MDNTFLDTLPTSPGVYKMLDEENNIIYVGKAGNLKKRVSSYFMKSNHSLKNQRLISKIKDIDYQITSNEQDALLLENNLIKEYKPKYNILLRDDKSYPYISLNKKHEFPGFKFFRGKPSKDGQYFGPYTHVVNVRKILSILQFFYLLRLRYNRAGHKEIFVAFDVSRQRFYLYQLNQWDFLSILSKYLNLL